MSAADLGALSLIVATGQAALEVLAGAGALALVALAILTVDRLRPPLAA